MNFIVVTGGIASGKSTVVQILEELGGDSVCVFDCDAALKQLYRSGRLSRDLVTAFGPKALNNGVVNRDFLREIVKNDPKGRHKLEAITHPKLVSLSQDARESAMRIGKAHSFILDIPLYFESNLEFGADVICCVALSRQTQIERIMLRDCFDQAAAEALIDIQMPTQEKINRSHFTFWNEGSPDLLEDQVRIFYDNEMSNQASKKTVALSPIDINELQDLPFQELQKIVASVPGRSLSNLKRPEIIRELARHFLNQGREVFATGILETPTNNFSILRYAKQSFRERADDVYISSDFVRDYQLRPGNEIKVQLRPAKSQRDKYNASSKIIEIEGMPADEFVQKTHFDKLTALFPSERLILENINFKAPSMRILDLITPLGKGQRALVVAPPRGGKTVLIKCMAQSIRANYPEVELIILLLDERPEEVTDFEETVDAPVYASTFDEPSIRHAQLSDLVLERARRLVEQGRDVVIMLDSLTRLSRGYNANQSGGRIMSGGLGSNALEKPRKFFGAARNVEEGGSLTIVATCLIETESRMDEIIFEEFKGTGNMEIHLDRELAERRIYPAIAIAKSGTRNDDRLYHPDELMRVHQVRRQIASMHGWEGLEALIKNIRRTQNNAEVLLRGLIT